MCIYTNYYEIPLVCVCDNYKYELYVHTSLNYNLVLPYNYEFLKAFFRYIVVYSYICMYIYLK